MQRLVQSVCLLRGAAAFGKGGTRGLELHPSTTPITGPHGHGGQRRLTGRKTITPSSKSTVAEHCQITGPVGMVTALGGLYFMHG